jgi:hypothetical protein
MVPYEGREMPRKPKAPPEPVTELEMLAAASWGDLVRFTLGNIFLVAAILQYAFLLVANIFILIDTTFWMMSGFLTVLPGVFLLNSFKERASEKALLMRNPDRSHKMPPGARFMRAC